MHKKGLRRLLDWLVVTGKIEATDEVAATLEDIMSEFREGDRKAISLRFGLEDGKYRTYDAVAEVWSPPIKKQRVEQLVNRGLRRLRYHTRMGRLKQFVVKEAGKAG